MLHLPGAPGGPGGGGGGAGAPPVGAAGGGGGGAGAGGPTGGGGGMPAEGGMREENSIRHGSLCHKTDTTANLKGQTMLAGSPFSFPLLAAR